MFKFLKIGHWDLFGNWKLEIGNSRNEQQRGTGFGVLFAERANELVLYGLHKPFRWNMHSESEA